MQLTVVIEQLTGWKAYLFKMRNPAIGSRIHSNRNPKQLKTSGCLTLGQQVAELDAILK